MFVSLRNSQIWLGRSLRRLARHPPFRDSILRARRRFGPVSVLHRLRVRSDLFAEFGSRSVICPPFSVGARHRIAIGQDVWIDEGAALFVADTEEGDMNAPLLRIGDRVLCGKRVVIACRGSIDIESDVLISNDVHIADTYPNYWDVTLPIRDQGYIRPRPVRIGRGVCLGVFSVVLPGVSIGRGSLVGAGAVVTRDISPHCIAVGNPARVIRYWDESRRMWVKGSPDKPFSEDEQHSSTA
jgi:acetyltransferase-like isoleucine patch superfamily enzyme